VTAWFWQAVGVGPFGWYKYARGDDLLPVTEHFRFAKADQLWGGEGWTLRSTRVTPRGTLRADVHGDWAHPSFPGDWNCIVPTHAELTWSSGQDNATTSVATIYQYGTATLRVSRDGTTTSQQIDNGLLSPLMRATQGPTIVRLAKATEESPLTTIVPWFHDPSDSAQLFTPQLEHRQAEHSGRLTIETPEGMMAGEGYRYIGGNYTGDDQFLIGRDGLLQAYTYNGFTIWRSAKAPDSTAPDSAAPDSAS
jgi:hypothetical protein